MDGGWQVKDGRRRVEREKVKERERGWGGWKKYFSTNCKFYHYPHTHITISQSLQIRMNFQYWNLTWDGSYQTLPQLVSSFQPSLT